MIWGWESTGSGDGGEVGEGEGERERRWWRRCSVRAVWEVTVRDEGVSTRAVFMTRAERVWVGSCKDEERERESWGERL